MKKYFYIFVVTFFIFAASDIVGAVNFWLDKVDSNLKWTEITSIDGAVNDVTNAIAYLVWFFYLIAVVLGIYAGFLIMTSAGDEERVKKWKNIFIYVLVGLIVVFLASTIISFVVRAFDSEWPINWGQTPVNSGFSSPNGWVINSGNSWDPASVIILDPNTGQQIGAY